MIVITERRRKKWASRIVGESEKRGGMSCAVVTQYVIFLNVICLSAY